MIAIKIEEIFVILFDEDYFCLEFSWNLVILLFLLVDISFNQINEIVLD